MLWKPGNLCICGCENHDLLYWDSSGVVRGPLRGITLVSGKVSGGVWGAGGVGMLSMQHCSVGWMSSWRYCWSWDQGDDGK